MTPPGGVGGLDGVWGSGAGDVWVVGGAGVLLRTERRRRDVDERHAARERQLVGGLGLGSG